MRLAEWKGKNYGVPYSLDVSTLFYNKDLFKKAGLDPNKPPMTWDEIKADANKIDALGGNIHGFYFAGNGAGFNAFTMLPFVWAQGGQVIQDNGNVNMDSPDMKRTLEFYRSMWKDGLAPKSAKSEDGSNMISTFATGRIGIMACGNYCIAAWKQSAPKLSFGNGFLPGPNGGHSSFGGGDVIGISSSSDNKDAAWKYIKWVLSKKTQVNVLAKNSFMVDRTDLASNKYANPLIEVQNKALKDAQTPKTLGYNEVFNNANGPWGNMINSAIFKGDVDSAMKQAQKSAQQTISSSKNQ